MQTAAEIHYEVKKCFCDLCFQMSTRPEKFIHQKEATAYRHKRDYSTELYEEWIASQGDEDMMDLDDNEVLLKNYKCVLHLIRHPLMRSASSASASSDADGCIIRSDDATIRKIQSGDGCFFQ
ncbi:hypothetical protein BDC45DRAFT_542719 [Circinella umbellata]|nr:hypothetical protein BDC45DRAFT_542719 [Circinella umbellata]